MDYMGPQWIFTVMFNKVCICNNSITVFIKFYHAENNLTCWPESSASWIDGFNLIHMHVTIVSFVRRWHCSLLLWSKNQMIHKELLEQQQFNDNFKSWKFRWNFEILSWLQGSTICRVSLVKNSEWSKKNWRSSDSKKNWNIGIPGRNLKFRLCFSMALYA